MKTHYIYSSHLGYTRWTACGLFSGQIENPELPITKDTGKITCKNCKKCLTSYNK